MKTLTSLIITCMLALNVHAQQPNILFFIVDDLNDYIGVLGSHPQVETPHIDSLAAKGVTFVNAYCNSPGCGPSRTSLLSGKSPDYTKVYSNAEYASPFRSNFSAANGNETVFTIPEVLKDNGNYFTYALGKVFHSPGENDYDGDAKPMCEKSLSWNKMNAIHEGYALDALLESYKFSPDLEFGTIPDELESELSDHRLADSAVAFIHGFANHTVNTCDRPFFLTLGIRKPHAERLIPEHYFLPYYLPNLLVDSFPIIYNNPPGSTPYNGLVMAPQPEIQFGDYYNLVDGGIGQVMANQGDVFYLLNDYVNDLPYLPEIDPSLTTEERIAILQETMRANYLASYIAAVQYMDSIVGKVLTALYDHPELAENTVVIFTSDHGFSLGEKRHWTKWSLWETDIRIPMIISYPGLATNATCKRVTSLLDLFPTICDIASAPYPVFPDGTPYIEGKSLLPFVADPNLNPSTVAITSNLEGSGPGSCFPHYSIRSDRFHYIVYRHNNDEPDGLGACDETSNHYEKELYDIGPERQFDPHEWNNLADNPEYEPLMEYFNEFLPGGDLYHSSPYTANIYSTVDQCLLDYDDVVTLRCLLISDELSFIDPSLYAGYTFEWTNNLTDEAFSGYVYHFSLSSINEESFAIAPKIIFYLKVTDNETGKYIAFRMKELLLHPESLPDLTYTYSAESLTLDILFPEIHGNYHTIKWDFGDGFEVAGIKPGIHTYATAGEYPVTTTITYGNKCLLTETQIIEVDTAPYFRQQDPAIEVFPIPALTEIHIEVSEPGPVTTVAIYDMTGKIVVDEMEYKNNGQFVFPIRSLPAGLYILQVRSGGRISHKKIEIAR